VRGPSHGLHSVRAATAPGDRVPNVAGAMHCSRRPRPQRGWCGALSVPPPRPGQGAPGPCHERDTRQEHLGEQPTVDAALIEEQQRPARRPRGPAGALVMRRVLALIPERAGQARAHQDRQAEHPPAQARIVVVRDLSQRQRMDQFPELGLICEPKHRVPREQPSRLEGGKVDEGR
jgi:hypothetical protein